MRSVDVVGFGAVADAGDLPDRLGDAGLVTAAVGVGAVAARAAGLPLACPLHALTGIPCPGCGMTRLADAAVHADLAGTVGSDPLGMVVLAAVGALALGGIAARSGVTVRLPSGSGRVPAVLVGVLLVRWALVLVGVGPDVG